MNMNKINSLKRFEIGFVSILILLTILLVIAIPVNACYYKVGTFESDYTTYKISFFKGETVYGKGNLYDYDYFLKLRIKDPQGNIVYTSNKSQHVVYCSYLLNNTAMAGIWSIQLGVLKNNWQWSNLPGRISFFTVKKATNADRKTPTRTKTMRIFSTLEWLRSASCMKLSIFAQSALRTS